MRVVFADWTHTVRSKVASRLLLLAFAGLSLVVSHGCKDFDPPAALPFQIVIRVESDPGHAVGGASVMRSNTTLGTTGVDGRATLLLKGADGETTDVSIRCPDAYTSPLKPTTLRLTHFADKTKFPEYGVSCPPMFRHVVVAVQADNGPNLPVVYLNKVVTRTDLSGAAHFSLEIAANTQFQVTLDTGAHSRLKPVNPSKPFTVPAHDDILVFDQKFELDKPERIRAVAVPRPTIPRALN